MLDLTTEKGRYISAALALAAERRWDEVTLADIAARAGATLVGLKCHFSSKGQIVSAFVDLVDDEVLSRAPQASSTQGARDRLFEVVMSRFDVLEPWKVGLRSIARSTPPAPGQVARVLLSSRWMLEAAGINAGGAQGAARAAGLASVYASVFRLWLDDEDPGLARTMAALDRRLARGERSMRRASDALGGLKKLAGAVCGAAATARSRMERGRAGSTDPSATRDEGPTTASV